MGTQISRRSFLKSLGALSLATLVNGGPRLLGETSSPSQAQGGPNVLIVVFDALTAMDMSLYGYPRPTTPRLQELANRATVYHAHYAGGNYTTPGTSSLLTGTYPWSHRAFNVQGTYAPASLERNLFKLFSGGIYQRLAYSNNWTAHLCLYQLRQHVDALLNPREFSLFDHVFADRFFARDADIAYRTERFFLRGILLNRVKHMPGSLAVSLGDEALIRTRRRNTDEQYADLYPRGTPNYGTSSFLLEDVIDGIHATFGSSRQTTLSFFQPLPPHGPYNARREFVGLYDDGWMPARKERHFFDEGWPDDLLERKRIEYDECIAYVDAEFGRLFDLLEQSGILDNTYVVFTSDHGEMFERGIYQHSTPTLYDPIIRIPLLIFKPGQQQREDVYTPTSCVDLLPTLLHLTGQAIPDWCEGEVLPTFRGAQANRERSVYAVEARSNLKHAPLTRGTVALMKDRYKLVHYFGYKGHKSEYELYDLHNDPQEVQSLYAANNLVAAELKAELEEKLHEVNQPYRVE